MTEIMSITNQIINVLRRDQKVLSPWIPKVATEAFEIQVQSKPKGWFSSNFLIMCQVFK